MNLVDCFVTKVLTTPYEKYGRWWVGVEYDSWGHISKSEIMLNTEAEANAVDIGHKFLA